MTALSAPAPAPAPAATARPHLTRWVLRLHRPALYVWTALVLLSTVLLLLLHGPFADAAAEGWRRFDSCGFNTVCRYDQSAILRYKDWYNYATLAVAAVPFLTAAWAGGALFGKELESGTAQLSWAQSSTPVRWLSVRLATAAVLVTAGTGLLAWLHHLAWAAGRGRIDSAKDWYDMGTFLTGGPTLGALSLAGLAAGALAGLLWRRTLPALAFGTLLTGVIGGTAQLLLPHLWPTLGRSGHGYPTSPAGSWTVSQGGNTALYHVTYHPYSHYWPLQLTATALLLTVTAVLTLACFVVLRRLTGRAAAR